LLPLRGKRRTHSTGDDLLRGKREKGLKKKKKGMGAEFIDVSMGPRAYNIL